MVRKIFNHESSVKFLVCLLILNALKLRAVVEQVVVEGWATTEF